MSDSGWQSISRKWVNCETFMVCVDDVQAVKKVNLDRSVSVEENRLLPGLEVLLSNGEPMEVDYLEEAHRDQVYDAIWAALKG